MHLLTTPLEIGPVKVRNRVFLAPMSGVSDLPFRQRAQMHGAGLVVSEMIASEEFCRSHAESRKRAEAGSLPVYMLQLAGRDTRWMAEAARIAEGEGVDVIDINMGCPAKKVTGGYSGSALMRDLKHAMSLIEATVGAVAVPVTLKMRLGWDARSINAPELARQAQDAGVRMITVHGRTREQLYNGRADWSRIAEVRDVLRVPLVVNGDIADLASAERALNLSGADAVMVGRESCGRPWLPGEIAAEAGFREPDRVPMPQRHRLGDYVVAHYEDMLSCYGKQTGMRHARKHLGWYLDRYGSGDSRKQILTCTEPEEVKRLMTVALSGPGHPETITSAEAA